MPAVRSRRGEERTWRGQVKLGVNDPSETSLTEHAVRLTDVNSICGALYKHGQMACPNWEERTRVPKEHYNLQRPK